MAVSIITTDVSFVEENAEFINEHVDFVVVTDDETFDGLTTG